MNVLSLTSSLPVMTLLLGLIDAFPGVLLKWAIAAFELRQSFALGLQSKTTIPLY